MKRILLYIILLLTFVSAKAQVSHISFMGIPLDGTISMFEQKLFAKGLKDGIPIGLGYFAVAFSLGIIASSAGLNAVEGFVGSFFTRASAGEYGVYSLILSDATYVEILVISLITNLRYLLMSTALSQKFSPETSIFKRI